MAALDPIIKNLLTPRGPFAGMDRKDHNKKLLATLKPGDLVEFPRGLYSHWGVYIGNGKIVHLAGVDNDGVNAGIESQHLFSVSGTRSNKAKVCIQDFWKIVNDCYAKKGNEDDENTPPLSENDILRNAESYLGKEIGYNLIFNNCEHFAKWCRYGLPKSDQVKSAIEFGAEVVNWILSGEQK